MTKYIIGPDDIIRMHSEKYDKDIYLMGDIHGPLSDSKIKNSKKLHLFLNNFFKKSDINITYDFFFETGFYDEIKGNKKQSYMGELERYFRRKECFYPNRNNKCHKEYPNVRFHAFDIRVSKENYKLLKTSYFWKFVNMYKDSSNFIKNPTNKKYLTVIADIKEFILLFRYKKNIITAYESIFDVKIIKSQLDAITDKKLKNRIISFYKKKWEVLIDRMYTIKHFYNKNIELGIKIKYNTITNQDIEEYLKDTRVNTVLGLFISLGTDLYLSLRLFRDFNDSDKSRISSKKILIYSGMAHNKNYIELLNDLGFKKKESSKNYKKSFQDISEMKQPFFT